MAPFLPPLAFGYFGLGTGYLIWAGAELSGRPIVRGPGFDRAMAYWGCALPGGLEIIAGLTLLVGLTLVPSFTGTSVLYVSALGFLAFGIHWFAVGARRATGADPTPEGFMAIPFTWLALIGTFAFLSASDLPFAIAFAFIALVFVSDIATRLFGAPAGPRAQAILQLLGGLWLMYLTFAITLDYAVGSHFAI